MTHRRTALHALIAALVLLAMVVSAQRPYHLGAALFVFGIVVASLFLAYRFVKGE